MASRRHDATRRKGTYAGEAQVAAAVRGDGARVEQGLALVGPDLGAGGGGGKRSERHDGDEGGFQELHAGEDCGFRTVE